MKIAPGVDSGEWDGLNLTQDKGDWVKATKIFEERISARYIEPADLLMESDNKRNPVDRRYGFSIMAIDCLLIETLQSFKEGKTNTKNKSKSVFVNFLTQSDEFKAHFDEKQAERFYNEFRCGILHQAEVMGEALLWSVGMLKGKNLEGVPYINRTVFHECVKKEVASYIGKLNNPENQVLRKNFINKMNFIARVE